jgi:TonB family protein
MSAWRATLAALALSGAARCRPSPPGQGGDPAGAGAVGTGPSDQEPPVALNADSPIQYPPRLYAQKVEGDVVLRLFVDSTGRLSPESSRVAESSGYPALDSAALTGARQLRFAPARRHGLAVATAFLQPIEFRHPAASGAVTRGGPGGDGLDIAVPRPAPRLPPPAPPSAPLPAPSTRRVRSDTALPRPRADTARMTPDTARARPDTGASPH